MTHINDGHEVETWLDHIVCTRGFYALVDSIKIDQSILSSDHFPTVANVNIQMCENVCQVSDAEQRMRCVVRLGFT